MDTNSPHSGDGVSRRRILRTAAGGAVAAALTACTPKNKPQTKGQGMSHPDRPNVLVIITDQQHAGMMSCAGNSAVRTPAMDGLAANGVRFECAYASDPVCIPARTSFMTGHYPSHFGFNGNGGARNAKFPDGTFENAIGHVFRRAGYETVYGGKTHWPRPMSIEGIGFTDICRDERGQLADQGAAWLKQTHEKPFLMVASFINPHDICYMAIDAFTKSQGLPLKYPKSVVERSTLEEALRIPEGISREEFIEKLCPPLPDNFEIPQGEPQGAAAVSDFTIWARKNWSADDWRLHRWAYARLTEAVDRQIGTLLDGLRQSGLERDTIVVFTSDHGDMDSSHRLEHKSVFYEESTRVPMIVRGPGIGGIAGSGVVDRSSLVSSSLDLLPTICDLAGVTAPENLPGRSLRPLLGGQKRDWRDDLVVESHLGRMIRSRRYKYAVYSTGQQREHFIDLEADPGEMKNLAGDPAMAELIADHRRRLRQDIDRRNDRLGQEYLIA